MARKRKYRHAIRERDRLRDSGPDPSGNYSPNPYAARGHVIEIAPKDLDEVLPRNSQFPKRIATQRAIDRYLAHGLIGSTEWAAAEALLRYWTDAGMHSNVSAGYDPVMVQSSPDMSGRIAKWLDAALGFTRLMNAVPYRCQGVVRAVVIEDRNASDWARLRGFRHHDSERHGLVRLRSGLSALATHLWP